MEKMKKIKNMCELEKYVGEMAHKKTDVLQGLLFKYRGSLL